MSKISNKTIGDYLEREGIPHAKLGFRYLMIAIRVSLDGEVNCGRMRSVYEAVGYQTGALVGQIDCAIRRVVRQAKGKMTNKEFVVRAVDTLTWEAENDAEIRPLIPHGGPP